MDIRDKLKKTICNTAIFFINMLPLDKKIIANLVRLVHFCFPLCFLIPLSLIEPNEFKYVYYAIGFVIFTQIYFDGCLLTDIEENYTDNIENLSSVSVTILNLLNVNPVQKNKRMLTAFVTVGMLFWVNIITQYRIENN